MVETARSQIGAPYRFGGDTPQTGFDCSGFVQWTFARHGVRLPRRTADQAYVGDPVPISRLEPGDLVFFQTSYKIGEQHVGISDGQGRFIHSPSSGGRVRLDNLDSPYWRSVLSKARRVLR